MATVFTTALWPQPDRYTGSPAVCTGQATAVPATVLNADGYRPDSTYTKPVPRTAIALGPVAARFLFPDAASGAGPVTAVPAGSPFTRYPVSP